jgi:hypothetical protein
MKQIRDMLAHFRRGGKVVARDDMAGGATRIVGCAGPATKQLTNAKLLGMVREVVDLVQPQLPPYQAAFYWHLFRQTILEGDALVSITTARLRRGVVKQQRGLTLSETQVRKYLKDLERVGAIRKEGEARATKAYRVMTPSQIEAGGNLRAERPAPRALKVGASEMDYYNVRVNRMKVYVRDGYRCR